MAGIEIIDSIGFIFVMILLYANFRENQEIRDELMIFIKKWENVNKVKE